MIQTGIEPLTSGSSLWVLIHQTTPNTWQGQVQYSIIHTEVQTLRAILLCLHAHRPMLLIDGYLQTVHRQVLERCIYTS